MTLLFRFRHPAGDEHGVRSSLMVGSFNPDRDWPSYFFFLNCDLQDPSSEISIPTALTPRLL